MPFIDDILQPPSYGWMDNNGLVVKPSARRLWKEALSRVNVFQSRKNWISFLSVAVIACLLPVFYLFVFHFLTIPLLIAFVFYSIVVMGTHGTVWYHRYSTHKAFTFSHPFWRFVTQHLVIKMMPEEMYVVSHHVHHSKSDEPGDPYNATAGLTYCMLAEFNHQRVSPTLSEESYRKVVHFISHTGVKINSYKQYLKWGSVASPFHTIATMALNWLVWFGLLYLIGGFGLVVAIFSAALFWFILVRTFNYTGHGKGTEKHVDGVDYDKSNLSINQLRPGLLTGEWHNNHHLYPASARAGFLPHQLDLAWMYIYALYKIGGVASYRDSKKDFLSKYRSPTKAISKRVAVAHESGD